MKTRLILFSLLCITIITTSYCHAQANAPYIKNVSKKFKGRIDRTLVAIDNQFGDIIIKTWDRDEAQINGTITIQAGDKDRANQILSKTDLQPTRSHGIIICHTKIDSALSLSSNEKVNINYILNLPSKTPLRLKNKFGNIDMGDFKGQLSIDESFGNLKAGNLLSLDSLNVKQGNVSIVCLHSGWMKVQGFETVNVDTVAGPCEGNYTEGQKLHIGFSNERYKVNLGFHNIQDIDMAFPKEFSAYIALAEIVTKIQNHSSIKLVRDSPPDTSSKEIQIAGMKDGKVNEEVTSKKIKRLPKSLMLTIKAPINYHGEAGDGAAYIKIYSVFSTLNLRNY
ncbi:MAG TPA: hypothetical protein VKR32_03270 [Puia sp.]|nr:hypothetical protein [Puia sp.]